MDKEDDNLTDEVVKCRSFWKGWQTQHAGESAEADSIFVFSFCKCEPVGMADFVVDLETSSGMLLFQRLLDREIERKQTMKKSL